MSLQLIVGSSGEGKSYELYQYILKESQKYKDRNYMIIVPEQFTLQTQKDIVRMHPLHGIMNIDVLSFLRLSFRILEETGGDARRVLEETGKGILVRKALEDKKNDLQVFKSDVRKTGFGREMKSLVSEFLQYSVGEDDLEKMIAIAGDKPLLKAKLMDARVVYDYFRDLLEDKYITAEEVLEVLCDELEKSSMIKNTTVCFDGFTGFTPNQYKVLEKLMILCPKVYITVTMDRRENITARMEEFHLFYLSKKTIDRLFQIAHNTDTEIMESWFAGKKQKMIYRFKESPALESLEKNLFRYHWNKFKGKQDDVQIFCSTDPKGEIQYTVSEINHLTKDEGYRYRDIAVVTGDIEMYAGMMERAYDEAGFSYFIDYKKDIRQNPFVEVISAFLNMCTTDFSYEGVLRYIRSGMINITDEEGDILENYVIAFGIRGYKMYSHSFKSKSKRAKDIDFVQLNEIRTRMMEPIAVFYKSIKGIKTVENYTRSLYSFIMELEFYEKIKQYQDCFQEEERPVLVKEFEQIWQIVMELFEKLVELLGDEQITLKEYAELLETGFAEIKVGLIPLGVDQIVVGDIERTRLKDIRALFFVGVNDGVIPKLETGGGILSDMERSMLKEADIDLAPTRKENAFMEPFYLYLSLTKPRNKLYITYCQIGSDKKTRKPSYLIGKIKKMFPELKVNVSEEYNKELIHILDGDKGTKALLEGLRNYQKEEQDDFWKELYGYYKNQPGRFNIEQLVSSVYYTNEEKGLSQAVVKALYGNELSNSVTRLELFASCAFAHFMAYGLKLEERKQFQLEIPDIGELFHAAIENFSKEIKKQGFTWHQLSKEEMEGQRDLFVKEAVIKAIEESGSEVIFSSSRSEYMVNRLERMTSRTVWALCRQIAKGDFEPSAYEIRFEPMDNMETGTIILNEESTMRLNGRIDRMDECEEEEELYLKIIDYKSGSTEFDLQKIYYGLQLQLVVYLDAAMEIANEQHPLKKIIPAGIFYYNIDDPVIEKVSSDYDKDELAEEMLKKLRLNGLVNCDRKVLKKLDYHFNEKVSVKSSVIPVELTAKGQFSAFSSVAREGQFEELKKFVRKRMEEYGKQIVEGETAINPYQLKKKTACDYCKYNGICRFDKKLPGNQYRNLSGMNKEKIWEEFGSSDEMDKGTKKGD